MTKVRNSTAFLTLLLALSLTFGGMVILHPAAVKGKHDKGLAARRQLVADLELTDLCLFTEARYTRNPSQADLNSAFQDHPLAFEHFPSGALLLPPLHLLKDTLP